MLSKKVKAVAVSILLSTLLPYQIAVAEQMESIERISAVVKNFVNKNITVEPEDVVNIQVTDISDNLKIPVCTQEIEAALPQNANKDNISTVELTCNGANHWHVFIPVQIQISTKVLVAKQTILAKEMITEADIDTAMFNKNRLYNGYFKDKQDVIGYKAAHTIPAGALFTKKNTQAAAIVLRNQAVNVTAKRNGISVSVQCVAKSDGTLNSVIKVYNPSSKQTLDAVVTGPNKAEVVG